MCKPSVPITEPRPAGRTVITFGTYDLFHFGHLRILQRSATYGDRLVVGVSSDALNYSKKQKFPAIGQEQRMAIVAALECVDEVFLEDSLELKKDYCIQHGADVLVMGDDHLNEYNEMLEGVCDCEYLPRTDGVSSTMIKQHLSSDSLRSMDSNYSNDGQGEQPSSSPPTSLLHRLPTEDSQVKPTGDSIAEPPTPTPAAGAQYSAAGKNLVRATTQSNPVTKFLVDMHDLYYAWIMRVCTPFCAWMPRELVMGGQSYTVFTANIVTYGRGFLAIVIALAMKYGYLWTAGGMVMYHDFLDHLDGVVAKQQALDGRSKGDDGMYGAFVDAQMDKLVFCLSLWSFLLVLDYGAGSMWITALVVVTCATLFALEFTIAGVRTQDYFRAKYTPVSSTGSKPALRAVSEGKLKQKFESVGIALYCLALPNPTEAVAATVAGSVCLFFAAYYSTQSLAHKLRARAD